MGEAGTRSRRWTMVGGLAIAVIGALALSTLWPSTDQRGTPLSPATTSDSPLRSTTSASAVGLPEDEARRLEQGLNARDPERLVQVLAVGEQDPAVVAVEAVPEGGEVRIDESSFKEIGGGGAVVEAVITDASETYAVVVFIEERDAGWVILGSTPPEPR